MLIILSREQKQVTVETSLEITLEIVNIWKGMNAMLWDESKTTAINEIKKENRVKQSHLWIF